MQLGLAALADAEPYSTVRTVYARRPGVPDRGSEGAAKLAGTPLDLVSIRHHIEGRSKPQKATRLNLSAFSARLADVDMNSAISRNNSDHDDPSHSQRPHAMLDHFCRKPPSSSGLDARAQIRDNYGKIHSAPSVHFTSGLITTFPDARLGIGRRHSG